MLHINGGVKRAPTLLDTLPVIKLAEGWYHMIWYDMIWYDMIWYDMIWYDMMWYNVMWRGRARNRTRDVWSEGESSVKLRHFTPRCVLPTSLPNLSKFIVQALHCLLIINTHFPTSGGWKYGSSVQGFAPKTSSIVKFTFTVFSNHRYILI